MIRLGTILNPRLVWGLSSISALFIISVISSIVGFADNRRLFHYAYGGAPERTSTSRSQQAESCRWRLGDFDWKLPTSQSAGVIVGQAIGPSPFRSRRMLVLLSLALETPAKPEFVSIYFGLTVSSLRILEPEMPATNSLRVFLKNSGYPLILVFEIDALEEGASIGSVSIGDNSPEDDITLMPSKGTEPMAEVSFAAGIFELCKVGDQTQARSESIARVIRESLRSHSDPQRTIVATEVEKRALLSDPHIAP